MQTVIRLLGFCCAILLLVPAPAKARAQPVPATENTEASGERLIVLLLPQPVAAHLAELPGGTDRTQVRRAGIAAGYTAGLRSIQDGVLEALERDGLIQQPGRRFTLDAPARIRRGTLTFGRRGNEASLHQRAGGAVDCATAGRTWSAASRSSRSDTAAAIRPGFS
jgi:hypothetical protein